MIILFKPIVALSIYNTGHLIDKPVASPLIRNLSRKLTLLDYNLILSQTVTEICTQSLVSLLQCILLRLRPKN